MIEDIEERMLTATDYLNYILRISLDLEEEGNPKLKEAAENIVKAAHTIDACFWRARRELLEEQPIE